MVFKQYNDATAPRSEPYYLAALILSLLSHAYSTSTLPAPGSAEISDTGFEEAAEDGWADQPRSNSLPGLGILILIAVPASAAGYLA